MTDPQTDTVHGEQLLGTAEECQIHGRHIPHSHVNERHHIWPQGHGGPTVPANLVVTCATGHNNVHALLAMMLKAKLGVVPQVYLSQFTRGERKYAELGYDRIMRKAL